MAVMKDYWKTIDTMVMGRKTYEAGLKLTKGKGAKSPYPGIKSYVFSRTLKQKRGMQGFEIISQNVIDFVRDLKQQDGKDICVMGGGLLASFVRSRLDRRDWFQHSSRPAWVGNTALS